MIDLSRFLVKYRWFITIIGVLLLVQFFLAIRLVIFHSNWDDPDGSSGPRSFKWTGGPRINTDPAGSYDETLRKNLKGSPDAVRGEFGNTESSLVSENHTSSSPTLLNLSTLHFIPKCNITLKESISAINRAKTPSCKKQLVKTSCKIIEDSLYLKSLPRFCENNVTSFGKYVGCYKDDKKKRILPDYFVLLKDDNSPKSCVELCLQSGFQYAGIQYRVECFCGNSKPSSSSQLIPSKCDMKCPISLNLIESNSVTPLPSEDDWTNLNCGGFFAMNVFETGVFKEFDGKFPIIGLDGFSRNGMGLPEKSVRVVFFLTLNGRALRQVFRLIKALFHERHYFYIHVDARQDYLYRELLVLSHKLPLNVKFVINRKATIWGGASLLTILLSGMEDLTNHSEEWGWEWDYVINLSESDFPLKSTQKLEYFLTVNKGKNFLKSHGRDVQKFIQKQGLDKTFDECEYRMWRMGNRKLPSGILIDGGSDWIALHRNFVKYIVKSEDELVSGLQTVFKYTLLPAESFFHTLLRNSEMCGTFVDNNLHVTNWKRKLGCKCQYKNVVDWCGCSPNDFRSGDWNRLMLTESRLLFFGRKFEAIVNQGIINQLETWLYPDKFEKHYPTMDSFWLSLYHYHDLSPNPDDALVTLGFSLSRMASQIFTSKYTDRVHSLEIQLNPLSGTNINLIEISAYKQSDTFEGILVRFQTIIKHEEEELVLDLETWFKIQNFVEISSTNDNLEDLRTKLRDVRVGGDYDQKEQIFRNFAGALGPFSEPTLTYNVYTNESFNLTIDWIDTFKNIQSTVNITLTDGTTANFVKPTLTQPLTPGNWTVKIITQAKELLYSVKFLVLPLEMYQGNLLSTSDENWINGRSFYKDTKSSQPLQDWIDEFVSKYYKVQDFCLENVPKDLMVLKRNNKFHDSMEFMDTSICSHTQWSSLYPDPKSTISGINSQTGLLMP